MYHKQWKKCDCRLWRRKTCENCKTLRGTNFLQHNDYFVPQAKLSSPCS